MDGRESSSRVADLKSRFGSLLIAFGQLLLLGFPTIGSGTNATACNLFCGRHSHLSVGYSIHVVIHHYFISRSPSVSNQNCRGMYAKGGRSENADTHPARRGCVLLRARVGSD